MGLTELQKELLRLLKQVALELGENGRALTGLIGELSACELLGLNWQPSPGFDAIGPSGELIQIKSRKSWATETINPRGRLSRFSKKGKYDFDHGIFVELDDRYEVVRIWQLNVRQLEVLEFKEPKGNGLHVYTFRKAGAIVYPQGENKGSMMKQGTI